MPTQARRPSETGERYRVIIVGAGPAGIFAALELTRAGVDGVLLLEKGPDLSERWGG